MPLNASFKYNTTRLKKNENFEMKSFLKDGVWLWCNNFQITWNVTFSNEIFNSHHKAKSNIAMKAHT